MDLFLERQRNILMCTLKWVHHLEEEQSSQSQSKAVQVDRGFRPDADPAAARVSDRRLTLHRWIMVSQNAWRRCILLVLLPGILAQGCRDLQAYNNQDAQIVLNEMGGSLTRRCSLEKLSLGAKTLNLSKLVERGQDRISVVYQTVRQISKIYSMDLGSVTWPRDKVESLRILLDVQLRELGTCVRKPGPGSRPRKSSAIKKYFRELSKFLKRKGFSACAWEIARAETRAYFQQFPHIMAAISE